MSKLVRLVLAVSSLLLLPFVASPVRAAQGTLFVDLVPDAPVPPGTVLGVTVRVENTSSTETLDNAEVSSSFFDLNLSLVQGTVTTRYRQQNTPSGTILEGNGLIDQEVHVELDPVPPNWEAEVSFQVKVPDVVPAGVEEGLARIFLEYADGALVTIPWDVIVPIVAEPELVLGKSDGGASVVPGGTVAYELTVENVGTQEATGLVLTDTVPVGTRFVAAGSSAGWSCTNGGNAGGLCSLAFPSLAVGTVRSFDLVLQADGAPVAAGVDEVRNVALVWDDGANSLLPQEASAEDVTPLVAAPDLRLSKGDGGVTVEAGEVVVYTLSYSNAGDQDATGVVLEETVPFHASFEAGASAPGWVCSGSGGGSDCSLAVGDLAAGSSGQVDLAVRVVSALTGGVEELVNRASVRDDGMNGADPVPGDNQAVETTPVDAAPDLFLTKDGGGGSVRPGEVLVYTLSYGNEGTQTGSGVALREVVPEHTVFVAGASDPEWTCSGGGGGGSLCVLLVGDLVPGDSGSVEFGVRVDPEMPAGVESVVNSATIEDDGGNGPDPDPEDDEDEVTTPVDAAPDLSVAKRGPGGSVRPGEVVVYTIEYANEGTQAATGVTVREVVPQYTAFEAGASGPGWSCSGEGAAGSECLLVLGGLAVGSSGSIDFAVRVDGELPAGVDEIANGVAILDDGDNGPDPDPGDDEDEVATPVDAAPDLAVTKRDGGGVARPGEVVVYTIGYENLGDQAASGVVLEETVPAFASLEVSASSDGWGCGPLALASSAARTAEVGRKLKAERIQAKLKAERIQEKLKAERIQGKAGATASCSFSLGDVPAGAAGEVTFAVRLDDLVAPGVEELVNRVRIGDDGANGTDPDPGNDEAVVTTPLEAGPDLGVVKDDDGGTVEPGGLLVYTLSYRNRGDQGASGVLLEETVPEHARFAPAESEAGWACDVGLGAGSVCTLELGEVVPGQGGSVRFAVEVDGELPEGVESVVNTAVIRDDGASGPDLEPEDDRSTVTTPVEREEPDPDPDPEAALEVYMVDLLAEDRDESGSFSAGDVVTYSVEIRNVGDAGAEGVTFRVPVPEHTEYLPGSAYAGSLGAVSFAGGVLEVELGSLGAGLELGLVWDVTIDPELPAGVSEIRAQGSAFAVGVDAEPSDDPDTLEPDDPTVTVLGASGGGPGDPHDIPTVSQWGLLLLGLFLGVAAWRVLG